MKSISLQSNKYYLKEYHSDISVIFIKDIERGSVANCIRYREVVSTDFEKTDRGVVTYTDGVGELPNYTELPLVIENNTASKIMTDALNFKLEI